MGCLGCPWCILYTTLKPPPLWAVLTPPLAHIAGPTDKQPSKLARQPSCHDGDGENWSLVLNCYPGDPNLAGGDTPAGQLPSYLYAALALSEKAPHPKTHPINSSNLAILFCSWKIWNGLASGLKAITISPLRLSRHLRRISPSQNKAPKTNIVNF